MKSFALVDLMMSDLGGTDLISTIRVTGFAAPLVVMSDVENEELLQKSLKAGAVDYLVYPITSLRLSVAEPISFLQFGLPDLPHHSLLCRMSRMKSFFRKV